MAAKSVEEIKAEVTALVKSQGNQGAISLGTVLDDITELAGGGGGGGGTPNVIRATTTDGTTYTIENPDDLAGIAEKAANGESVMVIITTVGGSSTCLPMYYSNTGAEMLAYSQTSVRGDTIYNVIFTIDIEARSLNVVNTNITVSAYPPPPPTPHTRPTTLGCGSCVVARETFSIRTKKINFLTSFNYKNLHRTEI